MQFRLIERDQLLGEMRRIDIQRFRPSFHLFGRNPAEPRLYLRYESVIFDAQPFREFQLRQSGFSPQPLKPSSRLPFSQVT